MAKANVYHDLPNQSNSIRLLKIKPGWPSDPIEVDLLVIADRKASPPYHALSYVWGARENPVTIRCNGLRTPVTANLASALRALRLFPAEGDPAENGVSIMMKSHVLHSNRRAWRGIARNRNEAGVAAGRRATAGGEQDLFWIDAICINQDDKKELAAQVSSMRDIYLSAHIVRIWLGDELVSPDGSALQLPEMATSKIDRKLGRVRLAELGHMPVVLSFLVQALRNVDPSWKSETDDLMAEVGFPKNDAPEYQILRAFFDQPWFHRVWTVQEAVLAASANIMIGDWELDWVPFAQAIQVLEYGMKLSMDHSLTWRMTGATSKDNQTRLDIEATAYACTIQRREARTEPLIRLLDHSQTRKATNPVDHVFAVLGMAKEIAQPSSSTKMPRLLTVDYTKPAAHVFRDATWFIILNSISLAPITVAEFADNPAFPDCPTWVPVWSQPRRTSSFFARNFNTHNGTSLQLQEPQSFDILCVTGYTFETVRQITGVLPMESESGKIETGWHYPPWERDKEFVNDAWRTAFQYITSLEESNGNIALSERTPNTGKLKQLLPRYQRFDETLKAFVYTLAGYEYGGSHSNEEGTSDEIIKSGEAWLGTYLKDISSRMTTWTKIRHRIKEAIYPANDLLFQASLLGACFGRRFFVTENGFFGVGSAGIQERDIVAVVLGLPVPLILRDVADSDPGAKSYMLIGECYVHGIMDGELMRAYREAGQETEILNLI
ncbi:hypothetical protein HD806DRAFT_489132 [Xylariaceae sp. AK1471]|nr:hypothetical protein HD806DRAFT_489132 [Xylariaceae sp. AK1471]